jgi:hypothetical protein
MYLCEWATDLFALSCYYKSSHQCIVMERTTLRMIGFLFARRGVPLRQKGYDLVKGDDYGRKERTS